MGAVHTEEFQHGCSQDILRQNNRLSIHIGFRQYSNHVHFLLLFSDFVLGCGQTAAMPSFHSQVKLCLISIQFDVIYIDRH